MPLSELVSKLETCKGRSNLWTVN